MKFGLIYFLALLAGSSFIYGQDRLDLLDCYQRAEENYPLIRQKELLEKTKSLSLENASKGYLPQIMVGGQATYQSDVTEIPADIPGIEPLNKDQYKIYGEIAQSVYNGGLVRQLQQEAEINGVVESGKLAVELYQIRNRINELFFGIMLLQEQIIQSRLIKNDITATLKKTEAAVEHGTALRSAADLLKAEILRADQRIIELQSNKDAYLHILGLFINRSLDTNILLESVEIKTTNTEINRPELTLLNYQQQSLQVSQSILAARKKPRVDVFAQAGYGRPGLNMLENEFNFFYLGGIRLTWLLSGFYTYGREKELSNVKQQSLDVQKETFVFNARLSLDQYEADIKKLQQLTVIDNEIINLRIRVKQTAAVQLEQGVISSGDYVREINAEDQARQNLVLHQIQLMMAKAKHQFTSGN